MRLVERASKVRTLPLQADSGLRNYEADAHGWLYFYLDRDTSKQDVLVKVDQIAVQVYWAAPDLTKQRIVGRRGEDRLPNEMIYHLDHFTVFQNDFGRAIRMGGGEEVNDVPHPIAAGADSIYDYRLEDSTSIYLSGATQPIRVYRVEVKPKHMTRPAIIGSVYIDRATAQIARMSFTFTPAAYLDKRLDYIRISLDNGLWEGRYWLPYQQEFEIRRKIPILDFPIGSVIRGRYKVSDYRFNQALPLSFFSGPRIVMLPDSVRRSYAFRQGLYSDMEREGLQPGPDLAAVRSEARHIAGQMILSGLPRVRLLIPGTSSALRYDRAEGVFLGAGLSFAAGAGRQVRTSLGYAFGSRWPWASTGLALDGSAGRATLTANLHELRDAGQQQGAARALNTVATAMLGDDYLDPYFVSGARLTASHPLGPWSFEAGAALEHQEPAHLVTTSAVFAHANDFRPVRPIEAGWLMGLHLGIGAQRLETSFGDLTIDTRLSFGSIGADRYLQPTARIKMRHPVDGDHGDIDLDIAGGATAGDPPPQALFLLGGRATLPGFDYRAYAGDTYARVGLEANHRLWWGPVLSLRALAGAGWSGFNPGHTPPPGWDVGATGGVLFYAGAGLGVFSGVGRLDVVRGFGPGHWQLILSVRPDLWGIL